MSLVASFIAGVLTMVFGAHFSSVGRNAAGARILSFTSSSAGTTSSSIVGAGGGVSLVSCTGDSCAVTMGGTGTTVRVLGTTIVSGSVRNGRAVLRVDGREVALTKGHTADSGTLRLTCSDVTGGMVTFTATRR